MQSIAQPTWLEMHSVPRPGSGMNTISMPCVRRPSASSHLRVPSADTCVMRDLGVDDFSDFLQALAKRLCARSVIWSKSFDVALVQPLHQLTRAKRLLAHARDERLELGARQAEQVGLACGDRS